MQLHLSPDGIIFTCFWIFGLVNNVLYVVILSAAIDLVGPSAPKATVLLADIMPSFIFKLAAPFFIHKFSYKLRISTLIVLSFIGMNIVAFGSSLAFKLFGICMASLSSGLGELTFLQLTHFYSSWALAGFSSGTGAAGLAGSFLFMLLTVWAEISTKVSLILFSIVPFTFAIVYATLLPKSTEKPDNSRYQPLSDIEQDAASGVELDSARRYFVSHSLKDHLTTTLTRIRPLFVKYMSPLILVYVGEYVINQGITPTLLFPLDELPFRRFRDVYVAYGTLYQIGVFISRSSSPFFRVRNLYLPAFLQILNVFICIIQSLHSPIPNVYLMFVLIFYEGLLGGLAYVNTFLLVSEEVPVAEREFAMGAVTVSDSSGIVVAALISMWLEKALCRYQVSTGRPWCEME